MAQTTTSPLLFSSPGSSHPQVHQPLVSLFKSPGTPQDLGAVSRAAFCHLICVVTIAAITAWAVPKNTGRNVTRPHSLICLLLSRVPSPHQGLGPWKEVQASTRLPEIQPWGSWDFLLSSPTMEGTGDPRLARADQWFTQLKSQRHKPRNRGGEEATACKWGRCTAAGS